MTKSCQLKILYRHIGTCVRMYFTKNECICERNNHLCFYFIFSKVNFLIHKNNSVACVFWVEGERGGAEVIECIAHAFHSKSLRVFITNTQCVGKRVRVKEAKVGLFIAYVITSQDPVCVEPLGQVFIA